MVYLLGDDQTQFKGVKEHPEFFCFAAKDLNRTSWGACQRPASDGNIHREPSCAPTTDKVGPAVEPAKTESPTHGGIANDLPPCYADHTRINGRNLTSEKVPSELFCHQICMAEEKCRVWTYN